MRPSAVLFGLLVGAQGACMQTHSVRERPVDYIATHSPPSATFTLNEGSPVVVSLPRVIADTIFGWSKGQEVTIAAQNVKEVRVKKFSVVRNALIAGVALGAGTAVLISTQKGNNTLAPICASTLSGGQEPDERMIDTSC